MKVFAVEIEGLEGSIRFDDGPDGLADDQEVCLNVPCDHVYMSKREWDEIKDVGDAYFAMLAARQSEEDA
jgi:hypothetical protein